MTASRLHRCHQDRSEAIFTLHQSKALRAVEEEAMNKGEEAIDGDAFILKWSVGNRRRCQTGQTSPRSSG